MKLVAASRSFIIIFTVFTLFTSLHLKIGSGGCPLASLTPENFRVRPPEKNSITSTCIIICAGFFYEVRKSVNAVMYSVVITLIQSINVAYGV